MSIRQPHVVKHITTPYERKKVLLFIAQHYKKLFGTVPSEPDVLFAAFSANRIVGTVALDLCDEKGRMPVETIFRFDKARTPFPYRGKHLVQVGRWIASTPGVSNVLLATAATYALQQGKLYGICDQKPSAARAAQRTGLKLHEIDDAQLLYTRVPRADRPHYMKPPAPKLYMMDLYQMQRDTKNSGFEELQKIA